ncbi:MAG: biopolymer transporter ExbD [Endomicrobiales bacterium]|nr:biopolymer transporter ExbD [Endomicrobiales bacterium]
MKIKNKFKLTYEIPTSSQSDIAFLLIIFFIVTAIFFERTGIIFRLPKKSSQTVQLSANEFIKVEAFNDYLNISGNETEYEGLENALMQLSRENKKNVAIIYFQEDLKYGNFIKIFDVIKKLGNIKISIKPMERV